MVWDQRIAMNREFNTKAQITSWGKTSGKYSNLVRNNMEWRDFLGEWKGHKYMNPFQWKKNTEHEIFPQAEHYKRILPYLT